MSREYGCYCHTCKRHNARKYFLSSGYNLFQCLDCGAIWIEITRVKTLDIVGKDEKSWKNAEHLAYKIINRDD